MPESTVRMVIAPLCLWCRHFDMSFGMEGWSDDTPGYCGYIDCLKQVWKEVQAPLEKEYCEKIRTARSCSLYSFNEDLERLLGESK